MTPKFDRRSLTARVVEAAPWDSEHTWTLSAAPVCGESLPNMAQQIVFDGYTLGILPPPPPPLRDICSANESEFDIGGLDQRYRPDVGQISTDLRRPQSGPSSSEFDRIWAELEDIWTEVDHNWGGGSTSFRSAKCVATPTELGPAQGAPKRRLFHLQLLSAPRGQTCFLSSRRRMGSSRGFSAATSSADP